MQNYNKSYVKSVSKNIYIHIYGQIDGLVTRQKKRWARIVLLNKQNCNRNARNFNTQKISRNTSRKYTFTMKENKKLTNTTHTML